MSTETAYEIAARLAKQAVINFPTGPMTSPTEYAGHVASRRSRATGTTVVLLRGPESEMTDYPYLLLCDEHGGICEFETRRSAETFLSHPDEWCPTCQEAR